MIIINYKNIFQKLKHKYDLVVAPNLATNKIILTKQQESFLDLRGYKNVSFMLTSSTSTKVNKFVNDQVRNNLFPINHKCDSCFGHCKVIFEKIHIEYLMKCLSTIKHVGSFEETYIQNLVHNFVPPIYDYFWIGN